MEEWRFIRSSSGFYEVSNYGNIRNVKTGKILAKSITNSGYEEVCIPITTGKKGYFLVHRLVALAFIPNPKHYPCINHIDENKLNNKSSNLEWCTAKYNCNYGKGALARTRSVIQKDVYGNVLKIWDSLQSAGKALGINYQCISQACRGRSKTAGGYVWEYKNKKGGMQDDAEGKDLEVSREG